MTLRFGRPMVSIPGPSVIPDRVLNAMHRPMPNIYEGELVDLAFSLRERLKGVARTQGHTFMTIGNGHAAWQMALTNTLSAGDRILVLNSGHFARAWGEMAAFHSVKVEHLPNSSRSAVDVDRFAEVLAADTERTIRAVLVVLADTSSSARNDIQTIGGILRDADHPALFMVDAIASLGCDRYEMDAWGADVTVAASQKGLMVPPGLGLVWASDRAVAAHETAGLRDAYFDWGPRIEPAHMHYMFNGTAPIQHVYGMHEALDMIDEEGGIEAVWERHRTLAGAVHAAVDAWSAPGGLEANVADATSRSHAVTTVLTGSVDSDELRRRTEESAGLTIGIGLGLDGGAFRIGHMGHLNPPQVLGTLATIEAALVSMDAPLGGSGTSAAIAQLAPHL